MVFFIDRGRDVGCLLRSAFSATLAVVLNYGDNVSQGIWRRAFCHTLPDQVERSSERGKFVIG